MLILLALAQASTPLEQLRQIAATTDSSVCDGLLRYQGHGARPGATTEYPFTATVTPRSATWLGAPVNERIWTHGGIWIEDPWEPGTERDVIRLLACQPSRLAAWLLEHPTDWRAVDDELLGAVSSHLATLSFQDQRLHRLTWKENHPVFGDVENGVQWSSDGEATITMTEADTRWSAILTPSEEKAGLAPTAPKRVLSTPLDTGVHILNIPEADSRIVLITDNTRGVLLDVPLSSSIGEAVRVEATRLAPDVTDWTVVISHHHPHYTGGLRPWARAGATMVIHHDLEDWLRAQLATPRNGDPPVHPTIVGIRKPRSVAGGLVAVRPIDEASGHTDAFLVTLWNQTLYVADLARHPTGGPARFRGDWPDHLGDWAPKNVVSGFPLSDDAVFPMASLQAP